jgi:hypothetical protein
MFISLALHVGKEGFLYDSLQKCLKIVKKWGGLPTLLALNYERNIYRVPFPAIRL